LHPENSQSWCLDPEVEPRMRLAFAGDLMSNKGRRLRFRPEVRSFLRDCDFLVVNLEGVLAEKQDLVLVKQYCSESVLEDLEDLMPPERLVFSLGNNHAGDYGEEELRRTRSKIEGRGSRVFGTRDKAAVKLHERVSIHGATTLSNQWFVDHVTAAKLAAEESLEALIPKSVRVARLRYSSLYGKGQHKGTVIPVMVSLCVTNFTYSVIGCSAICKAVCSCK